MADLQITNVPVDGETINASIFNTNYGDIVDYVNDRNSGTSTWDAFYSSHASTIPIVANNSTGTQAIFQCKDNDTTVFEVLDGGVCKASNQIYGRFTKTSDQSFTSDSTKVTFTNDSTTQNGSCFSTSTSRFTATHSGKYLFCIMVHAAITSNALVPDIPATTGLTGFYVAKNGTTIFSQNDTFTTSYGLLTRNNCFLFTGVLNMNETDYLEAFVNSTGFTYSAPAAPRVLATPLTTGLTNLATRFCFVKVA